MCDNKLISHYHGFLTFWAMVKVGDSLFFSDWLENGLYEYNLKSKRTVFLKEFEEEQVPNIHNMALIDDEYIWFIPSTNGTKIAIYNIINKQIEYINVGSDFDKYEKNTFEYGFVKDRHIWLFPKKGTKFISIDMQSRNVHEYEIPYELNNNITYEVGFFENVICIKERIYIRHTFCNSLMEFVDGKFDTNFELLFDKTEHNICFAKYNSLLLVFSRKQRRLILFNPFENRIVKERKINIPENIEMCGCVVIRNDRLFIFPFYKENIYVINLLTDELEIVSVSKIIHDNLGQQDYRYMTIIDCKKSIYIATDVKDFPMLELNEDNSIVSTRFCRNTESEIYELINRISEENKC